MIAIVIYQSERILDGIFDGQTIHILGQGVSLLPLLLRAASIPKEIEYKNPIVVFVLRSILGTLIGLLQRRTERVVVVSQPCLCLAFPPPPVRVLLSNTVYNH